MISLLLFSAIYLSKATYVISSFNLVIKLLELIPNAILFHEFIDHIKEKQHTQHSLITGTVQIDFFSMDIHLLTNSWFTEAVTQRCSVKRCSEEFRKIYRKFGNCFGASFQQISKAQVSNFIRKETPTQVFPDEI